MADQDDRDREDQGPVFDRWSYPAALSRRGYVLAVLVPVLVAALGFGVVTLVSAGDEAQSGTSVRLPVAGYAPAPTEQGAPVEGYLRVDDDQCVYLQPVERGGNAPDQLWAVWPAGYRAILDDDRLTVYDEDREVVAQDGDKIRATGVPIPASNTSAEACLPDEGDVVVIESDVVVVQ